MGKVKDGTPGAKTAKPAQSASGRGAKGQFAQFVSNLTRYEVYKPLQGKQARLWTAVGLGGVLVVGLWRLSEMLMDFQQATHFGVPLLLGLVFGWAIFRLVEFPPFVEFLIATEAEMNKVSWTTRADLYRATIVVLATVLLVAVYLFGVDWLWSFLLQKIGVLRFSGGGAFGSQAG